MERPVFERRFTTIDGVELFYRHWPARGETRGAVLLMHRGHEHSGRMAHLVGELNLPDHAFYAWDSRGNGLSVGERGDAPSFSALVQDLDSWVKEIGRRDGVEPSDVAIVAQSVGAVIASAWVHDFAPTLRGMVLASPAFRVRLYVPFATTWLALARKVIGKFFVKSYVKAGMLSHDEERVQTYDSDPLVTRPISVDLLLDLADAGTRLVEDAKAITAPVMLLISGSDAVVEQPPQHQFFVNLGSSVKERHVLDGFFHDTLGERDREPLVAKMRQWLLDRFAEPVRAHNWLDADKRSFTRDEAEALATPVPVFSIQALKWAVVRWSLRVGGLVSEGLALGHRTGFDSGSSLDYVYENQARGKTLLGRLFDRMYLDQLGWRGIRQRKQMAEELIVQGLERLADAGMKPRIVDVAAGHGRYVLDALDKTDVQPDVIVLSDASKENVLKGRGLIATRNLGSVASFRLGDAFDDLSTGVMVPKPTLGVVSGLYELFGDNAMVSRSLAGLAKAIPPGGFLVYTCQPWHPQLELIGRTLTSHRDGDAWVMRRRTQAEMDQLVAAAGFTKVDQRVNETGLFTVALAQRNVEKPLKNLQNDSPAVEED